MAREQCNMARSYTTMLSDCCLQPQQKNVSKIYMHLRDSIADKETHISRGANLLLCTKVWLIITYPEVPHPLE